MDKKSSPSKIPPVPPKAPKKPDKPEVFISPDIEKIKAEQDQDGKIIEDKEISPTTASPTNQTPPVRLPPIKQIPRKYLMLSAGILLFFVVGTGAVLGLNKILFSPTSLHFVPDTAEFYIGISVRNHPQVQKLKELVEKFPGGKDLTKDPNSYFKDLVGSSKDPFGDIIRLSQSELLFAKVSETNTKSRSYLGIDSILSVVDLDSTKIAAEKLVNFKEDTQIYTTTTQDFENEEIIKINLKNTSSGSKKYPFGSSSLGIPLPSSQAIFASAIDRFIVSSSQVDDVKKAITLSKKANPLGFLTNRDNKNILSDPNHKKISKHIPNEYLVKFFQQKPLEPFSGLLPLSSASQSSFLGINPYRSNKIEGKNAIEVSLGLAITAHDDGLRMDSYQLDWRTPKEDLKNSYKISNSLASKIPQKFSGISPAVFTETNNLKMLMADQEQMIKEVAEESDNRNQRKVFEEAVKNFDDYKISLRQTFGVDPDKDLFSWMGGLVAFIFNPGAKGKSPEALVIAEIKDKDRVETSLKKIQMPNYQAENDRRLQKSRDSSRKYNLRTLANYLKKYYVTNGKYPSSLANLVPTYVYSSTSLDYYSKDPETKKPYKYTVRKKGFTLTANLEDGRKYVVTEKNPYGKHIGKARTQRSIKPLTPTRSNYKNTNIYSITVYSYAKTLFSMYFAVTSTKAVILFSDSPQSVKDIIDFEENKGEVLSSRQVWKDQFSDSSKEVGGLTYVEPIQFLGTWDYYKNLYSSTINLYADESDIEIVLKAYLKTLKSIGTTVTKEKPVYATKTFVRIEELPKDEKDKADDALFRLLHPTPKRSKLYPILGARDVKFPEVVEKIKDLFSP